MVVPVLMTSCQVSLKPKMGPVAAHTTTIKTAPRKMTGLPHHSDVLRAKLSNQSVVRGMLAFFAMRPERALRQMVPLWPNVCERAVQTKLPTGLEQRDALGRQTPVDHVAQGQHVSVQPSAPVDEGLGACISHDIAQNISGRRGHEEALRDCSFPG